jgi:hypothetical protein
MMGYRLIDRSYTMNIFEILQGKTVVYGEEDYRMVVTWNGSATFELFCERTNGVFDAIEVRTRCDLKSLEEARMVAIEFVEDMILQLTEDMAA